MIRLVNPVGRRTRAVGIAASKQRSKAAEYVGPQLTETEVERLIESARLNHHGHRDATMIQMAFRHGLRAAELVRLQWNQINFRSATLKVRRVNNGLPSAHSILGDELRALRRLRREQKFKFRFVFISQLGKPLGQAGFARMIERAGLKAGLGFKAHPHMLRHACGYALAKKGYDARMLQLYLGHRGAQYATRYIPRFSARFADRASRFAPVVGAGL